jgi:hypothetical protein
MPSQWDEAPRDDDLVDACLRGDETVWASLIRRYRRLIYTISLRFGMPLSAAEEIFQEVSLILLQKLHTLRDETRLSAWIVTVTRRACMQRWRQLPAAISIDELTNHPDEAGSDMEEALLNLERRHTLQQAMEQLVSGKFVHSAEFMRLALNPGGETGGTCFGDSGGPDLLRGTNIVLAVNSYVTNVNCSGVGYSARVDIQEVLDWINRF